MNARLGTGWVEKRIRNGSPARRPEHAGPSSSSQPESPDGRADVLPARPSPPRSALRLPPGAAVLGVRSALRIAGDPALLVGRGVAFGHGDLGVDHFWVSGDSSFRALRGWSAVSL